MGRYTAPPCRPIPSKPACAATSTGCAASATGCAASSCGEPTWRRPKRHWPRRIAASADARARRAQSVPALVYPDDLPVSQHREEIRRAIEAHPVVILAGETGSGKTTQLPKICLEAGPRRRRA